MEKMVILDFKHINSNEIGFWVTVIMQQLDIGCNQVNK